MMMNTKASTLSPTLIIFLIFFHLSLVSCRKIISHDDENGFTFDLIHRDSPRSPFYNPSTQSNRLRNAFHRSFSRASFFKKSSLATPKTIQSTITPIPGEYLMKIYIGTPPVEILAIADTGSDLTWTQCKPCVLCFQQSAPLFDSNKSSTYKTMGCNAKECTSVGSISYCGDGNICEYRISYGDQSRTIGNLAFDKFTFPSTSGKKIAIPKVAFGCGHENGGTFSNYTSGIIGLGGGEVSIINQLDKQIKGKFSYCLIPFPLESSSISNVTSHINFGSSAMVSGPNVVSTPLIKKYPSTFYYLNLEGVSVGNKRLEFKSSKIGSSAGGDEGNIIIDSGTTLTLLPSYFYSNLESTLVALINATRKEDPSGTFSLCYESDENGTIDAPTIVAHFTNADVKLSPSSTFAQVEKGLVCLTIVSAEYQIAIFGNLAQTNFLIGYDLVDNKVSFKPTDCTKY